MARGFSSVGPFGPVGLSLRSGQYMKNLCQGNTERGVLNQTLLDLRTPASRGITRDSGLVLDGVGISGTGAVWGMCCAGQPGGGELSLRGPRPVALLNTSGAVMTCVL
jgi:hypothetical protein